MTKERSEPRTLSERGDTTIYSLSGLKGKIRIIASHAVFDIDQPTQMSRWQISGVLDGDMPDQFFGFEHLMDAVRFNADVGALENFGVTLASLVGLKGSLPQLPSAAHQQSGDYHQPERERRQQGIGNFQAKPQEPRPELGSLLLAMFGNLAAAWLIGRDNGWGILCGLLLAFCGTFGLLFGFDLWSLYRLL